MREQTLEKSLWERFGEIRPESAFVTDHQSSARPQAPVARWLHMLACDLRIVDSNDIGSAAHACLAVLGPRAKRAEPADLMSIVTS